MDKLESFCEIIDLDNLSKFDIALSFIWFNSKITTEEECNINTINNYFESSALPKYNVTYLKKDLIKSKSITKGSKKGHYKLVRKAKQEFENKYNSLFENEGISIEAKVNLLGTPFLNENDISSAKKMAELYIIIHCYENSVRKLIETILKNAIGNEWWDSASSAGMIRKYNDRKSKEERNKWLSPRGNNSSPLYYLDWSDLVTLIRKYPEEFSTHIHDIKFVELRLEELEKIRNIVAHNGVIPSEDDFQRVILSFKDWCKQVS